MDAASIRLAIIERIDGFITGFERAGRNPDRWQSLWLSKALKYADDGDLARAETALLSAKTVPLERSPEALAEISIGYEPAPVEDHRANLERIKSSRPD